MEKNRIQPIKSGTGMRISYARQDDVLEVPNLIEIQKDSYEWFLREGLAEVFEDISPIEDYSDQLSLEFVDYQLCRMISSILLKNARREMRHMLLL